MHLSASIITGGLCKRLQTLVTTRDIQLVYLKGQDHFKLIGD